MPPVLRLWWAFFGRFGLGDRGCIENIEENLDQQIKEDYITYKRACHFCIISSAMWSLTVDWLLDHVEPLDRIRFSTY